MIGVEAFKGIAKMLSQVFHKGGHLCAQLTHVVQQRRQFAHQPLHQQAAAFAQTVQPLLHRVVGILGDGWAGAAECGD